MKKRMDALALLLLCNLSLMTAYAQGPNIWIFGRNAGLNFTSGQPAPVSYEIDNCYSPTSSQCDVAGNLLFYCDGRTIKDKTGQIMPGSSNPVWPAPMHMTKVILSNIVPVMEDTNRYYVFLLSPSSGVAPFGTYYSGVLTYSIVDMRFNNGAGGVDPAYSNVLLDKELDMDMIVAPANDCSYWLIAYRRPQANNQVGQFVAYKISEQGIAGPVYSAVTLPGFPSGLGNIKMIYAYKHHKIITSIANRIMITQDFDGTTGAISNGKQILDLAEFRSQGGGVADPAFCLSPDEKMLYLLGYPYAGTGPNGPEVILRQYPIDLAAPDPALSVSDIIFQSNDAIYQVAVTPLPLSSQDCSIRTGPDGRVYLFYNTGMSFLGQINKPNNAGPACDFAAQGVQLLPNTFGSYYFPSPENKRPERKMNYRNHDTTLCITEPLVLKTDRDDRFYTFLWQDGSRASTKAVDKPGTYWVRSAGTCQEPEQIDTFVVRSEQEAKCNCRIFIPNVFSPNNDNINDIFRPVLPFTCIGGAYHLTVYNRWGASVFHSYDIMQGWDGRISDLSADLGVYHYNISYKDNRNTTVSYKGSFTLLR